MGHQIACHAPRTLPIPDSNYPLRANDSQMGRQFSPASKNSEQGSQSNSATSGTKARASAAASASSSAMVAGCHFGERSLSTS